MTNDLEIRHCRVLLAVSEHGGVGAAARALGLAQSTVSEALLSLERLIGAPVMRRRRGKEAALTSMGEALLPHARALISASTAALAAVSFENRGVLRLGAVESASTYLLPAAVSAFRLRWPIVEVQVSVGLCDELRKRVRRGELDAALTLEGSERTQTQDEGWSRMLSPTRLGLIVASRTERKTAQAKRADLARRPFLLPDPNGPFTCLLQAWFKARTDRPRFESAGSIDGVKRGVSSGDLVGVLPTYTLGEELASRSLVELKVPEPLPSVALWLTTQRQPLDGSPLYDMVEQIDRALSVSRCLA